MSHMPSSLPPQEQQFITILRDVNGGELLRIGMRTYSVMLPGEAFVERRISDNLETVDGISWNPSMLQQNNPILLAACGACRRGSALRRPNHGLCTVRNARMCIACGVVCCPRHGRLCQDRHFRCLSCTRLFRLRRLVRPIFFARIEDD